MQNSKELTEEKLIFHILFTSRYYSTLLQIIPESNIAINYTTGILLNTTTYRIAQNFGRVKLLAKMLANLQQPTLATLVNLKFGWAKY